ncbi:hypothetical protein TAMA11512_06800 [Selenomonas sp. TAMA-11512]|uniref:OmpH family outer membrane protein n=1 Tax=Selenomonas sp. TAMA-11512 TaxID=3095337 RepID=UPI0030891C7B|nr:hypothetical protein TAMA11512_06800 [Selenomonas sp. TAMA-11512]
MLKLQKTQVKIFSIVIALVFIGSVVAIALTQSGAGIASAAGNSNVGVVDYRRVMMAHPDFNKANGEMQKAVQEAQMRFEANNANKSDEEKSKAYQDIQRELAQKEQTLISAIQDKVNAAVKQAADARGMTVVLDKSSVVYGGEDITADVEKLLK